MRGEDLPLGSGVTLIRVAEKVLKCPELAVQVKVDLEGSVFSTLGCGLGHFFAITAVLGEVLQIKLGDNVQATSLGEGKEFGQEEEDTSTEDRVLTAGQATEQVVAHPEEIVLAGHEEDLFLPDTDVLLHISEHLLALVQGDGIEDISQEDHRHCSRHHVIPASEYREGDEFLHQLHIQFVFGE